LSNLEADLRAMGEATSQTDPTFRTTQLYRRLERCFTITGEKEV
jgi:hypothetical protein